MAAELNQEHPDRIQVTSAMEDYLKAAYRLEQDGQPISNQNLAEALSLSQPSVTNMVKRLNDLNLVVHSPYKGVELTDAGRQIALEVIRHHRLVELYLSQALGYDLGAVHAEAERLEHHVSEELEARMEKALGFPEFDPHGDPIPDRTGRVPLITDIGLVELQQGTTAKISRLSDREPELLNQLSRMGLSPGVQITVTSMIHGVQLELDVNGVTCELSWPLATLVRVAH